MSDLRHWHDRLRAGEAPRAEGFFPPHLPTCFGCGPEAEMGLHAQVRRDGEEVVCDYAFADRHSGGPGVAHGGLVAALMDDVLGFLLWVVQEPGVTRRLEVDFLAPVLVGGTYEVRGRVVRREGRKLFVAGEGRDAEGKVAFTASGLFVIVPLDHFEISP